MQCIFIHKYILNERYTYIYKYINSKTETYAVSRIEYIFIMNDDQLKNMNMAL